jgi:hypothetical protein
VVVIFWCGSGPTEVEKKEKENKIEYAINQLK